MLGPSINIYIHVSQLASASFLGSKVHINIAIFLYSYCSKNVLVFALSLHFLKYPPPPLHHWNISWKLTLRQCQMILLKVSFLVGGKCIYLTFTDTWTHPDISWKSSKNGHLYSIWASSILIWITSCSNTDESCQRDMFITFPGEVSEWVTGADIFLHQRFYQCYFSKR